MCLKAQGELLFVSRLQGHERGAGGANKASVGKFASYLGRWFVRGAKRGAKGSSRDLLLEQKRVLLE